MVRLFILLFASFISFYSYSSDTVPKEDIEVTYGTCSTIVDGDTLSNSERPECLSFSQSKYDSIRDDGATCSWNSGGSIVSCGSFDTLGRYKNITTIVESRCPSSHPIDNGDGTCSNDNQPEPEPHSCPDSGTFFKRLNGGKSIAGFSTCLPENCVVAIQKPTPQVCIAFGGGEEYRCPWDVFYTGQQCSYNPDAPGLQPPDHEWPDEPVPTPDPDLPEIPDLPDGGEGGEGGGVQPPIYDPDGKPQPEDPVTKPNPDPTPDPDDPNLSDGDNAIVGELSEANQRLENIDHTLEDLTNTTKLDNDTMEAYQASLLGELQKMNTTLTNGIGGGGGGAGSGITDGLGEIACLLDETCEGGGSKSSVTENKCESFKCDGEAVVCYLARKEWAKTCEVEDFLAEGGAGSEFAAGINQFIDENPMEHLEAGNFDVTSVMNKYTNGNGFEVNSGCPAPRNVDVGFTSIVIEYQMFCDLAVIINWFLISFSLVSAALLIAKYGL
ncbi:TPA: virulence factor TspB C-terminal domain-related protein [Vibrio parahaemolyticus]